MRGGCGQQYLAAVELADDLVVDGLLALPLALLRPARVRHLGKQLVRPRHQAGVKFQRERGLRVVLGGHVQVIQLVHVAHVQRRALHFRRVEILQHARQIKGGAVAQRVERWTCDE